MFANKNIIRQQYEQLLPLRQKLLNNLVLHIEAVLRNMSSLPTIRGRIKKFPSFFRKYTRLKRSQLNREEDPLITDILGIRVICPFIGDMGQVEFLLRANFVVSELDRKGDHYSFKEFGYESTHLLIEIPPDLKRDYGDMGLEKVEIQIRTLLQDAWAEVEHELIYKRTSLVPFDLSIRRRLAAVNANLFLADQVFQEVRDKQAQLNQQITKRRDSFYKNMEDSLDKEFFKRSARAGFPIQELEEEPLAVSSLIDDLLLNALYAHNRKQYHVAVSLYSKILDMSPGAAAIIHKHRGLSYFAQSEYDKAAADFEKALELDSGSYNAAYYRGMLMAVQGRYLDAVKDYTLSLNIHPYNGYCFLRRAEAYYHLEDYPAALGDCEIAHALDPSIEALQGLKSMILEKLQI
jgi:putative GTP pyrophosphokinase